ncbi:hypothetical protein [Phyllobacterium leguminum]|uniref:Uncharacterized protein n=1 Tax=Phyllobacterium leguminum TaxID=314237 RepID=A0A318TBB7_9HYPH|nr:hypothetical protein [Phyllobacterium leguminum]PYE90525.1 hypothetical protein C7477_101198 [Phyllobacterium leguminum]
MLLFETVPRVEAMMSLDKRIEALRQAIEEKTATFDELAAELRKLTAGRKHTPSEVLLREARDER